MKLKYVIRMSIESITIHHTESSYLNKTYGMDYKGDIERTFRDLPTLENNFALAGSQVPVDAGSDKVFFTITFINGDRIIARMELNKKDCELIDFILEILNR